MVAALVSRDEVVGRGGAVNAAEGSEVFEDFGNVGGAVAVDIAAHQYEGSKRVFLISASAHISELPEFRRNFRLRRRLLFCRVTVP